MARKDGWVTPRCELLAKKQFIIDNCLEPRPFYDDWTEYRDGFRGYDDRTRIRPENMCHAEFFKVAKYNKKLKKMEARRRLKQERQRAVECLEKPGKR